METARKLAMLLEAAQRLGIEVRETALGGDGGGLCTVRHRRILFVDTSAEVHIRYLGVLRELAQLSEFDTMHLLPELREDIQAARS